jgi:integrase
LIGGFLEGRYFDSINYVDVENYRRHRLKTVSASTVNKEHAALTGMFNKFREWNRLGVIRPVKMPADNPGSLVKKANEKAFSRKRVLSVEEFERFLKCGTINLRRISLAAVHSTLRLKDLRYLTKNNVNEATNELEGTQAKTGKPYKVPITLMMRTLIDTAPEHLIFDFTNFRKEFEAARKDANILDFQFRDLRRTGARTLLKGGVDLATVSKYLGHASIQMTERYAAASEEDLHRAAQVLNNKFGSQDLVETDKKKMKTKRRKN